MGLGMGDGFELIFIAGEEGGDSVLCTVQLNYFYPTETVETTKRPYMFFNLHSFMHLPFPYES
jgi:hypothetical protein